MNRYKSLELLIVFIGLTMTTCHGIDSGSAVSELKPVEIRQYQEKNLSSIHDFEENSIAGPQKVALEKYQLKITGLVDHPLALTYDQVLAKDHYSKVITLHCVEGWDVIILWEGILIEDLLAQAGAHSGPLVVIFHAVDDYTSSLPLSYVKENKILLAYKMNGINLPAERGFPFLVVSETKWGYKWVKWVTEIELSADTTYQGYWESRGYNNNGEQTGPIFEP